MAAGQVSLLNTVDTGHEDMIHDAQMDYYGKQLATCSSDRTVKIFEVINNTQSYLTTLRGHDGAVWQVAWAHPKFGNVLASCSYDRKVVVWKGSGSEWNKIYEFCEHKSSVNSIQWAPHEFGLILACASSDESFSILSLVDGQWKYHKHENAHSLGCNAISWGPSINPGSLVDGGSKVGSSSAKRLVTGGGDNLVKVWREENDVWLLEGKPLESHTDWVRDVAWCPSVGLPVSRIASCSQDCKVIIWTKDESTGGSWTDKVLSVFQDVVWHASWSLTGDILAISGGDNKVSLWKESKEGEWLCVSEVDKGQQQQQQTT